MITTKSGRVLTGRDEQLYTGNCPPEEPCNPAWVAHYRALYDQPPDASRDAQGLRIDANMLPNRLWWFGGMALSFSQAMVRWTAAGCPVTPPEELAKREATCRVCPHYVAKVDGCNKCGCGVQIGSLHLKRSMASEECPDSPPRWAALK